MINMSDLITPKANLQNDSDSKSPVREGRLASGAPSKFASLLNSSGADKKDGSGEEKGGGEDLEFRPHSVDRISTKLDVSLSEAEGLEGGDHHLKKLRDIVRDTNERVLSNTQVRSVEVVLVKELTATKIAPPAQPQRQAVVQTGIELVGATGVTASERVGDLQKLGSHNEVVASKTPASQGGGAEFSVKDLVVGKGGAQEQATSGVFLERSADVSRFESNDDFRANASQSKSPVVSQGQFSIDSPAQPITNIKDGVETVSLNFEKVNGERAIRKHPNYDFINNLKNISREVSEKLELGDKKELRITVRPSHLGEIKVEIQKGIDGVKMSIVTSSEAVSNLLNQYKSEIMSEASKGLAGFGGDSSFEGSGDETDGSEQPSTSSAFDESSEYSDGEDEEVAITRVVVTNDVI